MRLRVAESQIEIILIDLERTIASTLAALRYWVQDQTIDIDSQELAIWHDGSRSTTTWKRRCATGPS